MKNLTYFFTLLFLLFKFYGPICFATQPVQSALSNILIIRRITAFILVNSQKNQPLQCLMNMACVNKLYYRAILDVIYKNPDYWNYFELTIRKSEKISQIAALYKDLSESKKAQLIHKNYPPLILSICLNQIILKSEQIDQLKNCALFFTQVKNLCFLGVQIPHENFFPALKNSLEAFSQLSALEAEGITIEKRIHPFLKFNLSIYIPRNLFITLEQSNFLPRNLKSLILNFNSSGRETYELSDRQVLIKLHDRGTTSEGIKGERLFKLFLKFPKLKKLGLIDAQLRQEEIPQLKEIFTPILRQLKYLDLSKNANINNESLAFIFSDSMYNKLQVLNLSETKINQECKIFSELKNLNHLIMRNFSELDTSIIKKLSEFETLIETLEELDLSHNQNLNFDYGEIKLDASKFKNLRKINIQNCKINWPSWINLKFFDQSDHLTIIY